MQFYVLNLSKKHGQIAYKSHELLAMTQAKWGILSASLLCGGVFLIYDKDFKISFGLVKQLGMVECSSYMFSKHMFGYLFLVFHLINLQLQGNKILYLFSCK